jgi:hypothetical protein
MNKLPGELVPRYLLTLLNNLYEIERKLAVHGDLGNAMRNVQRIHETMAESVQIFYEDPHGQSYDETRTDLEATITGSSTENLRVVEVIKPVVRIGTTSFSRVVQKGIVVVRDSREVTGV